MKNILTIIFVFVLSFGVFSQTSSKENKKNKVNEISKVLDLSEEQVKTFKKISNQKKKTVQEQKILIKSYKENINQAKQKLDQAKIIYEKSVIEMLSDDQKIKYEAFKSESKNNN